ncbi:MAG: DUF4294 domain-containing protein [Flavipsychrobacter sp.]|nr:DUF4294 domain-containing protein [Flavipsychrobacter sp.]
MPKFTIRYKTSPAAGNVIKTMKGFFRHIVIAIFVLSIGSAGTFCAAQVGINDTIRLGAVAEKGGTYPMAFLPEYTKTAFYLDNEARLRRDRLRRDIYIVYPYALTAATILADVHKILDTLESRRERKRYLRETDRKLDVAFKKPLKNLTVDQGHVLVKLINRQAGQNCYSIIRELRGGFNAVVWQSVGVMFNNNLRREYDPEGDDAEIENIVQVLESSANYRYHLYMQQELMRTIPQTASRK